MKILLEELNYIKYLFGYQKGKVISEQKTPKKLGVDGCENGLYFDCTTKQCIKKPEPDVGAGAAVYYGGSDQWPIINTPQVDGGGNIIGYTQSYASLGDELIVSNISSEGPSIGYISVPPGGVCSSSVLNQLSSGITSATNSSSNVVNSNSNKAFNLVESTAALRRQRSEREIYAWSLLQASASLRDQIELLEIELYQLININLKQYE